MPETRDDESAAALRIVVERSGGFAGLTRTWRVSPAPSERKVWIDLVEQCPWAETEDSASPAGADRFRWRITVTDGEVTREVELGDDLDAPWRFLVESVRSGHPPERETEAPAGAS